MDTGRAHEYLFGGEQHRQELFNKLVAVAFRRDNAFARGRRDHYWINQGAILNDGVELSAAFVANRKFTPEGEFEGYAFALTYAEERVKCKLPLSIQQELVAMGRYDLGATEDEESATWRSEYVDFSIANSLGHIACEVVERSIFYEEDGPIGQIRLERAIDDINENTLKLTDFYEEIQDPTLKELQKITELQTANRLKDIFRIIGIK